MPLQHSSCILSGLHMISMLLHAPAAQATGMLTGTGIAMCFLAAGLEAVKKATYASDTVCPIVLFNPRLARCVYSYKVFAILAIDLSVCHGRRCCLQWQHLQHHSCLTNAACLNRCTAAAPLVKVPWATPCLACHTSRMVTFRQLLPGSQPLYIPVCDSLFAVGM